MKQSHIAEGFANYFGHLLFGREFLLTMPDKELGVVLKIFKDVHCRLHIKNRETSTLTMTTFGTVSRWSL